MSAYSDPELLGRDAPEGSFNVDGLGGRNELKFGIEAFTIEM